VESSSVPVVPDWFKNTVNYIESACGELNVAWKVVRKADFKRVLVPLGGTMVAMDYQVLLAGMVINYFTVFGQLVSGNVFINDGLDLKFVDLNDHGELCVYLTKRLGLR
jgi:hypothetical protein